MRRHVIQESLQKIVSDLKSSGIQTMFEEGLNSFRGSDKGTNWISLEVMASFITAYSNYSASERLVLDILGLSPLTMPNVWQA